MHIADELNLALDIALLASVIHFTTNHVEVWSSSSDFEALSRVCVAFCLVNTLRQIHHPRTCVNRPARLQITTGKRLSSGRRWDAPFLFVLVGCACAVVVATGWTGVEFMAKVEVLISDGVSDGVVALLQP